MRHRSVTALVLSAVLALLSSCKRSASSAAAKAVAYEGCLRDEQLVGDDELTKLGTAADLLKLALGGQQLQVQWRELRALDYTGEGTDTQLTIHVTRAAGDAKLVHSYPNPRPNPNRADGGAMCEDTLELPVHVAARSADGVLSLDFDTILVSRAAGSALITHRQLLRDHHGAFRVSAREPASLQADDFFFSLGFVRAEGEARWSGELRGVYSAAQDGTAMALYLDFLCFPRGEMRHNGGFFPGCHDG